MLAGMIILMLLALYNGNAYYETHSDLIRESQEMTYQQFISQGDKNPHLGAHFGFYAYKPTADMAILMILAVLRNVKTLEKTMKQGLWRGKLGVYAPTDDPDGKTLGLIGLGAIGKVS